MTEKLKCCFCGDELVAYPYKQNGVLYDFCRNPRCKYDGWHFPTEIWHALIDGKKAQRQLRTVKDRCVKKIKAKEFEIHNCLYGIHARDCEIETLQEKLSQAQDALNYAIGVLDNMSAIGIGGVDMEIIKIKEMAGIK